MDTRLNAVAESRGGYFTRSEVLDSGYDDRHIRQAIRSKEWERVRPGVYAPGETYRGLSQIDQHLVMGYSVVDKFGHDVALSHSSACAHWGLAQFDVDLSCTHVTRLDGASGRREAGIVHHTGVLVNDDDLVEGLGGRLFVVPRRAVWEAATITTQRGALVVIDSALYLARLTTDDLAWAARSFDKWQGSRAVDLVVRLADGRSESAGESLTRFLCYEQHLPRPTLQHVVVDDGGQVVARTDFAWLEFAHVGEFDGRVKYLRGLSENETASDVVMREKRREDLIRRQRLGMSRVIWSEVLSSAARATGLVLRRDLEQSRSLYLHHRVQIAV